MAICIPELTPDLRQQAAGCRTACAFSPPESTERSHGNGDISVRSPEEEWSCNVIYLQASVNVCSQESTKLR